MKKLWNKIKNIAKAIWKIPQKIVIRFKKTFLKKSDLLVKEDGEEEVPDFVRNNPKLAQTVDDKIANLIATGQIVVDPNDPNYTKDPTSIIFASILKGFI